MKIKTICESTQWKGDFDNQVNDALEGGWLLARRDIIPGGPNDSNKLYAELVLPDPPAEPTPEETTDPFQALHQVQEFCHSIPVEKCNAGSCPLRYWCAELESGGDPTDWVLPEVEA